ncbi:ABRE binding factor 4 [Artemisia annua]|uniref:ABRE binding factor 4 n=1 Tax=Artemisia annua TaxID=35608 RepID=A0A2U1NXW6_ARTAN|nr:ABRE binding factor 4 [Artemisia annua]
MTNSPLPQQSSVYALTFEELQNTMGGSGKDFGSMNMDELLKNIWTAEETQEMTPNLNLSVVNHGNLLKQGSLTLPRTLSQKTVDEVWRELVKENGGHCQNGVKDVNLIKEADLQPQEKPPALREMTLEAFLQKAGVVGENNQTRTNGRLQNDAPFGDGSSFVFGFKNSNTGYHQQAVGTKRKTEVDNLQGVRSSQQPKPQKILPKQAAFNFNTSSNVVKNTQMSSHGNDVSIIRKTDNPIKTSMAQRDLFTNSNLDTSPSPPSYAYSQGVHERKRSGTLEKVVERRQKRMIKNRESAARSRARKQAYTLELEAEVEKLKEVNHELQKKQEEIMESQNFQVPEKTKLSGSRRLCLRRTLSGPW